MEDKSRFKLVRPEGASEHAPRRAPAQGTRPFAEELFKRDERERALRSGYAGAYEWLGAPWDNSNHRLKTFDNWDMQFQAKAWDAVWTFAQDPVGNLVLHGTNGTGKSHLLRALANYLITRGKVARYVTAVNLFAAIQDRRDTHASFRDILTAMINADIAIIDDIALEGTSGPKKSIYTQIIDARSELERPTALSTNSIDELVDYIGPAALDRMRIGLIVEEMVGESYRKKL